MASPEAEVATKAPESDAQEQTPTTTTDAPAAATATPAAAEEPPKMGENCHTDRPTRSSTMPPLPFPSRQDHELKLTGPAQQAAKVPRARSGS